MKIVIPKSVNVNELVESLNLFKTASDKKYLSRTIIDNIKNRIYYFLHLIVSDNENYILNEKTDGFRKISSVLMKKILGDNEYYDYVLPLLSNPIDPIIESDDSWYNPTDKSKKGYCMGYRLTEKYNTGEIEFKTLSPKFVKKIVKYQPVVTNNEDITNQYRFLLNQFKEHPITIDKRVYDFIKLFGIELLKLVDKTNPLQEKLIYNLIGRWLYYVDKIEKNKLWHSVSAENYRLNSSITNIPSPLRKFLLSDGKQLVNIDISASQPYLLSYIMNDKFYGSNTTGFTLNTIYPELNSILVSKGYIDNNIQYSINNNSNNNYSYLLNNNSTITNSYINTGSPSLPIPFMWWNFFTIKEIESVKQYQQFSFTNDYYTHVVKSYYENTNQSIPSNLDDERDKFKKGNMYVLFDGNFHQRNHNPIVQIFKNVYPGVDKWIENMHSIIGNDKFALLLQRVESYLLLNIICREFYEQNGSAPIFTVHDGLYTHEEYVPELTRLVLKGCKDIIGVEVGIKTKYPQIEEKPTINEINKVWFNKIVDKSTPKMYEKIRGGVFSSNINRGIEFLKG